MLSYSLLIVIAYAYAEFDLSSSQSVQSEIHFSQNQIYGSQVPDSGSSIQDITDLTQYLSPVALISSIATPANFSVLRITVRKNAQLVAQNDGFRITLVPSSQEVVATLTGGPANDKVYIFSFVLLRNSGYPRARVASTEDGESFAVQGVLFFINELYRSYANSLNYKDGSILIPFNCLVDGKISNPLFEPYRIALTQVIRPNSTGRISAYSAFRWLLSALDTGYFVHLGTAFNFTTGEQFPSATIVSPNFNKHPWLSYTQWKAFKNLRNRNNQPLAEAVPIFSLAGRRFQQADSGVQFDYN